MKILYSSEVSDVPGDKIKPVKLVKTQEEVCRRIVSTAKFFFKGEVGGETIPFRGFLLEGPPGNGKTEIVKQAVRRMYFSGIKNVYLRFVDSAKIAKPEWGRAEEILRRQFDVRPETRVVLLLDDVDCLFIKRGARVAQEWHYSINALIFHQLDILEPSNIIVVATTNRPSLIDYALRSRLYTIKIPPLSLEELVEVARNILEESFPLSKRSHETLKEEIIQSIVEELRKKKNPSIRDVQHLVVTLCIERGVWEA